MNFNKFILETFNGHDVTISEIPAVYTDFADTKLTKTFRFVDPKGAKLTGVSKTVYTMSVNADRTQLLASSEAVANTVVATIKDAANNDGEDLIQLEDNSVAKDLLNVAGRDDLANNLTARLSVETLNGCGKSLNEVTNNEFDVKFLRPITVKADKMDNFKDGVDVGAEGSVIDVKLAFTDWRNYAFVTTPINYYTYYGVKSITIDTDKAQTTVNGKYEPIPAGMKVEYSGVERGLDPLDTCLVVADASRTEKTICLAVSPALKKYGTGGRPRLFEVIEKVRVANRQRGNSGMFHKPTSHKVSRHPLSVYTLHDWDEDRPRTVSRLFSRLYP